MHAQEVTVQLHYEFSPIQLVIAVNVACHKQCLLQAMTVTRHMHSHHQVSLNDASMVESRFQMN